MGAIKMKIQIFVKDPNIEDQLTKFVMRGQLKDYQADDIVADYFKYGEYVTLELDTETLEVRLLTNFEAI
jgi:hypothetical protein